MSDIESLQYLSGQLRRGAQQFSDAAQKLQQQGQRMDWSAQDLASGVNVWSLADFFLLSSSSSVQDD